jgi:hypothetical protein
MVETRVLGMFTPRSGAASASHIYTLPCVYIPKLTVTDKDNAPSAQVIFEFVVVYDPSAGYVTGNGTVSAPGAYLANPTASYSGKLAFNTRYKLSITHKSVGGRLLCLKS